MRLPAGLAVGLVTCNVVSLSLTVALLAPGDQPRCTPDAPKLCGQLAFLLSGHSSAFLRLQEGLYSQILPSLPIRVVMDLDWGMARQWETGRRRLPHRLSARHVEV